MKKDYSIEALKNATDKYLKDLEISKYVYCLTCSLAERLLAYSNNFNISSSSLLEGTDYIIHTKISFSYLNVYQFVVEVYGKKSKLYPNTFTVYTSKEGYTINVKISTDNIDDVFNEIIKIAEGKSEL